MSVDPNLDDVGTPKGPAEEPPRRFRFGLRHLLYIVFYCGIAFWLIVLLAVPIIMGSLLMIVAAGVGLGVILGQRRGAQQDALLWALAIAAERQMPLAPTLDAVAEHSTGEYRRKVRALAHYLGRGMSLPEALDREPGALPRDAEVLVRIGWEAGTLAPALRDAVEARTATRPSWTVFTSRVAYFLWVLMILQGVVAFIMYFILPKFEAIFKDFGVNLPAITIHVIHGTHFIVRFGFLFALVLLLELALLVYWPLALAGWSRYYVPGIDRLFAARHTALVLRSLAWVVEGNKPLPWGVEMLTRRYPTRWVRTRLGRVVEDLAQGSDWLESLVRRGLVRGADASVLDSARRVGNLSWALRETAEGSERRLMYRLQAWSAIFFPMVVIGLGMLIGLIVVAYFSPLITLIEALAT